MKLLIFLAIFIALAKASDEETQAKIKSIISTLPKYKRPTPTSRIIGGVPTEPHGRPYQVAMAITIWGDNYFCSGTLISTKFVLTAAHCIWVADNGTILLGAYDLSVIEASQIEKQFVAADFRVHEGWNMDTAENDIATIELNEAVNLNDYIKLIELPRRTEARSRFVGRQATVLGWGITSDDGIFVSPVLREANVTVMTNIGCHIMFKIIDLYGIRSTHICNSGFAGTNVCNGDSGGPMLIGDKQIGITSWGYGGHCEAGWPSVFTRVTSFLSWIEANSDVKISP